MPSELECVGYFGFCDNCGKENDLMVYNDSYATSYVENTTAQVTKHVCRHFPPLYGFMLNDDWCMYARNR